MTRLMPYALGFLMTAAVAVAVPIPSPAAHSQNHKESLERTVDVCREALIPLPLREVAKTNFTMNLFNAYVESNGTTVRYIGTPEQKFAFEKCLSQRGVSRPDVAR